MITRTTILLFCLASLLFSVPFAFYAGEMSEYRLDHPPKLDRTASAGVFVTDDPLRMMDFGMRDWMRYCVGGSLVVLVVALGSLLLDFRKLWMGRRKGEHPTLSR